MEHPDCFMYYRINISRLIVNLNFYWAGVASMEIHGSLVTTWQKKVFIGILLVRLGKYRTRTSDQQKWAPRISQANDVKNYLPTRLCATLHCVQQSHHLDTTNFYTSLRHKPAHITTVEISFEEFYLFTGKLSKFYTKLSFGWCFILRAPPQRCLRVDLSPV